MFEVAQQKMYIYSINKSQWIKYFHNKTVTQILSSTSLSSDEIHNFMLSFSGNTGIGQENLQDKVFIYHPTAE